MKFFKKYNSDDLDYWLIIALYIAAPLVVAISAYFIFKFLFGVNALSFKECFLISAAGCAYGILISIAAERKN